MKKQKSSELLAYVKKNYRLCHEICLKQTLPTSFYGVKSHDYNRFSAVEYEKL